MISYIRPEKIIKTEQFVREPVDDINRKINNSTDKKFIVTGSRGSGKSLILFNTQDRGLGTDNQTVLMRFDSIVNFASKPDEFFDERFFNHYYEMIFSWKLLTYIKKNYGLTYEKNFKYIEETLKCISRNVDNYINNVYYDKVEILRYLTPKEVSSVIIEKFKKCLGVKKVNLAIDRFDWVNGSSAYTQELLSKYFDMFDKVIISVDELSLPRKKEKLQDRGFSFVPAKYGKNVDVIKQIIRKRIKLYNESPNCHFDENVLTDKFYDILVKKAKGNINLVLDVISEFVESYEWQNGNVNVENEIYSEMDYQLDKLKLIRKMDSNNPKLYL